MNKWRSKCLIRVLLSLFHFTGSFLIKDSLKIIKVKRTHHYSNTSLPYWFISLQTSIKTNKINNKLKIIHKNKCSSFSPLHSVLRFWFEASLSEPQLAYLCTTARPMCSGTRAPTAGRKGRSSLNRVLGMVPECLPVILAVGSWCVTGKWCVLRVEL